MSGGSSVGARRPDPDVVLVLDLDGVCNSEAWLASGGAAWFRLADGSACFDLDRHLDPVAVGRLARIVAATRCSIVLSSMWRYYLDGAGPLTHLRGAMVRAGHPSPFPLVGMTPKMPQEDREVEIASYLYADRGMPGGLSSGLKLCVLDDNEDGLGQIGPQVVLVDKAVGLQDFDVERAIERLGVGIGERSVEVMAALAGRAGQGGGGGWRR